MTRNEAEEAAINIIRYYNGRRGVGHTSSLVNGTVNNESVILTPTASIGRFVWEYMQQCARREGIIPYPPKILLLQNTQMLRRENLPLVIEHTALVELLMALTGFTPNPAPTQLPNIQTIKKISRKKKKTILAKRFRVFDSEISIDEDTAKIMDAADVYSNKHLGFSVIDPDLT